MSDVKAALQEVYDAHGTLTPALVVEVAAAPGHPLHDRFEWDDTEAARRFRLVQASGLIRSVRVEVDRGPDRAPVVVRAFVAEREAGVEPPRDDDGLLETGRYRPVEEVVASDVLRSAWFKSLARDWQALRRRAGASEDFAAMVLADLRGEAG